MSELDSAAVGELRDDRQFAEFESGGENIATEGSDLVFVSVRHFLDQAMQPEAVEEA